MIKAFCIWYLRVTDTAVLMNLILEDDVHVTVRKEQKKFYHSRPDRCDNGSLHIYYE